MTKKIKGEDGKVYIQKKPFYKKWWFWLLAVIVVGSFAGGGDEEAKTDTAVTGTGTTAPAESTQPEAASSEAEKEEEINTFKTEYDAIALGDSWDSSDGGMTYDEAVAKFGEPSSNSESTYNDSTTKISTWSNVNGGFLDTLVITFTNNNATGKGFSGFSGISTGEEATLEQFNAVPTDGTYTFNQVILKFGEPDSATEYLLGGHDLNTVGWATNVKGDFGANFNLTIIDGVVTEKSQYNVQ